MNSSMNDHARRGSVDRDNKKIPAVDHMASATSGGPSDAAASPAEQQLSVLLSARSTASISLETTASGARVVTALTGADAAAHLRVGDILLSVNGHSAASPGARMAEAGDERESSVLALGVQRKPTVADAAVVGDGPTPTDGAMLAVAALSSSSLASCSKEGGAYAHVTSFGGYGLVPGKFSMPCNLISLPDGDLAIADAGCCRIQLVSPGGELRRTLGSIGEEVGSLNYPAGLALVLPRGDDHTFNNTSGDGGGDGGSRRGDAADLLVVDRGNCRVQRLRLSDGTPLASSQRHRHTEDGASASRHDDHEEEKDAASRPGGQETEESALNYPWGIALHGKRAYVSDMRGCICVLDATTLRLLGRHTPSCGLSSPHAIAIAPPRMGGSSGGGSGGNADDGAAELYVADHDHHRVVALKLRTGDDATTGDGAAHGAAGAADGARFFAAGDARIIGGHGTAACQFQHPVGLALLGELLLVSEFTGRRVQGIAARTGEPRFIVASPFGTRLLGVCAAPDGNTIFAGDFDADLVHVWERAPLPMDGDDGDRCAAAVDG